MNNRSAAVTKRGSVEALPLQSETGPDFSLVVGGPLYQFLIRIGLLRPPMARVSRRIFVGIAITWFPLLVLATLSGTLLGGAGVSFINDIDVHVRFLIALPLLLGAEVVVHSRIRMIVNQFLAHGIILKSQRKDFLKLEDLIMRVRNSVVVEVALIIIAFTIGDLIWRRLTVLGVDTWYADISTSGSRLTAAGWWFAYVSLPIVRFLLLRWYFRIGLWYLFLWRVARLRLQLNPLNPDRAGGLGFLGANFDAFSMVLVAQSSFVAGVIGNKILHQQATLPEFQIEIMVVASFLLMMAALPLFFFMPAMAQAKREALPRIRGLAARYTRKFSEKWLGSERTPAEELLGSADIQSLADLDSGVSVACEMGVLPFTKAQTVRALFVILIPFAPLVLTVIPFEELIGRLAKLIL